MIEHIKMVAGHYKGKVTSWDVVNEPFDDESWDGLRPNIWYTAIGEGYIAKAFIAAHEADPNALLFINDYGLEDDSERWDAMLALVSKLKKQGVPLDGVGFQAHVYERSDKIDPVVLQRHIRQLAAAGLKARISEMDVYSEDGAAVQSSQYSQVLKVCLAEPNCIAFTSWGVSDKYDWFKDDDGSLQQGEDFLWNRAMQPTPAVAAMQQILR
jgi:endo-1,4-beta-xylanase